MSSLAKVIEKDPNLFFGLYDVPVLIYLEFGDRQAMGDPNLLGFYNFSEGSKSRVLLETIDEAVNVGLHEVYHAMFAHSETQHRYMESQGAFNDPRNYRKIRSLIDNFYKCQL
ncbi:hypothetical protein HYV89_03050 [Candidatus Woesearchaeota archaeon]|nr:hypothetical protein [Candidatus Woesearchaeota archaeon]